VLLIAILGASISSNAMAGQTVASVENGKSISSFPSGTTEAKIKAAENGERLNIISSPSASGYQPFAAETVAVMRIYSFGDGLASSSSSGRDLGHSWLMITNFSGRTQNIAGINVADGKSITASTWDTSVSIAQEHRGLWLNLDSYLNRQGTNTRNVSIQVTLRQVDLDTVNTNIRNNDRWGYATNCSTFASAIWNSVAIPSTRVNAGIINTPASLSTSIEKVGNSESYTVLKRNSSSPHYYPVYYGYPPKLSARNK
jgi:hypothetical protein